MNENQLRELFKTNEANKTMNGSSKYFDPANWVFENFADKVGYVITQGKVRDRTG